MQMWEWVIQADRERDLADPVAAAAWFAWVPNRNVPLRVKWDTDHQPWSRPIVTKWQQAVHSLRSLSIRLKNKTGRSTDIDPLVADRVFQEYVSRLLLVIARTDDGDEGQVPLRASTFKGVGINPGVMSVSDYPKLDKYWAQVAMIMDGTWRKTFGSLATDQIPAMCSGCGKALDPTPTGRPPRTDKCKACAFKTWYDNQPKSKLRDRWRTNKAAERSRQQEGRS